jgi:hypothetical protein
MELLEGKEKGIKNKYKTDTGLQRKDFLSAENKALAVHIRNNPVGGASAAAPATQFTPEQLAAEAARRAAAAQAGQ